VGLAGEHTESILRRQWPHAHDWWWSFYIRHVKELVFWWRQHWGHNDGR